MQLKQKIGLICYLIAIILMLIAFIILAMIFYEQTFNVNML